MNLPTIQSVREPLSFLSPGAGRTFATRSEIAARAARQNAPFGQLVSSLFDNVEKGLADILASNPGFTVARTCDNLAMTLGEGQHKGKSFVLAVDEASRVVSYTSPKTGERFDYCFDASRSGGTGNDFSWSQWLSSRKDGTLLVEHLARDLVYYCKGYPNF